MMTVKILNEDNQYEFNVGGRNIFICSCQEHEMVICGCNNDYCNLCFPSNCACMSSCIELRNFIFPPENISFQDDDTEYKAYLITKCRMCKTEHIIFAFFGAKYASDRRVR